MQTDGASEANQLEGVADPASDTFSICQFAACTGYQLTPHGDVEIMAQAIRSTLLDLALARRLSERGKAWCRALGSHYQAAADFLAVYAEAMGDATCR